MAFFMLQMVEIHQKKPLDTSLIFILKFEKNMDKTYEIDWE
jgi:hypothetical protein